ncbi:MAG: gliding motility-associated C-terminal domain-containing protein [Raineya sp.]|jgi:gliding motility-associated-like protein|nr:gliding motility-associated C-terminal domain-containing protein [Raineya sp.]
MKKYILLLFLCLIGLIDLQARHILGGQMKMQYLSPNLYRFTVEQYFDTNNGTNNPTTYENQITIVFYKKSDNTIVMNGTNIFEANLDRTSITDINFPIDTCGTGTIRVKTVIFSGNVTLSNANFSDAQGYYAIWQRCCRNNTTTNIVTPGDTGNTFYLEFPPVNSIINSSPTFTPPQGDFLCLNSNFNFNFSATDADGDRLVYSLVDPFNVYDDNPFGPPDTNPINPSPFTPPTITWVTGFSATNAIPSNTGQPLSINAITGELSVNPSRVGLFVFSVKCEEYRVIGGIDTKIGEVRRDYQFLVKNCQGLNPSPQTRLQLPNGSIYQENTLLDLDANQALCLNLQFFDTPGQSIKMTYYPISDNAKKLTLNNHRPFRNAGNQNINAITINSSGIGVAKFCWRECLYSFKGDEIFEFGIISDDQGCPAKGIDTLFVKMKVRPKFNNPPSLTIIQATPNFDIPSLTTTPLITSGQEVRATFQAFDKDNDSLRIFAVGRGLDSLDVFTELDITFTPKEGKGKFTTDFIWRPDCRFIKTNGQNDQFIIDVILREKNNTCNIADDTLTLKVNLKDVFSNVDNFLPANTFTPNGDGVNDVFQMEDLPQVADFNRILPLDNCLYQYNGIKIYNRWGKPIYESQDRNFKWDGSNLPMGVYYYVIDYTSKRYKGTVNLIK